MHLKNERGQSLLEYLILTAVLGIASMGIIRLLGHSINAKYADITNAVQGYEGRKTQVERVEDRHYKKRDMGDFMRGAVSPNGK